MNALAIGYESEALFAKATQLQEQLHLPIDNHAQQQLLVTADRLELKMGNFAALFADFSSKTWQKRRDAGKKQGLVRACKPGPGVKVIDLTAGWGRDAAVLASFGAEVLMLERNPVMAVLLRDALERQDEHSKEVLKLKLCHVDALDYLRHLEEKDHPDVIYIDPMHPQRNKSALVKKDMQALQQLIGADSDVLELLEFAVTKVLKRVVIKWPQHLPPLLKPTSSVSGKTVRFDSYNPLSFSEN
ncbi:MULTISPECIES: class I SAM-dependent methyltransferase [Legionella]|uniref:Ribosomal RNA small subunit methyltransferase J n=1 Tax=Legionella maceachernii TaxID=466 RepID=A0A0W0WIM5_9GAMM|nr:class I SAM-dependent methyltransferase [Legionella maceachernii]KTD31894.1 SAM-dependent methyltransferase [Legionella maceachernii]SJZ44716.1 16S rRNA (guanine1516-N2)-methyltransferase [Legionella maceachernii]SUP04138.1 Ribosomal RNA small subunit methyltransferase J [Legionella maceachernii]